MLAPNLLWVYGVKNGVALKHAWILGKLHSRRHCKLPKGSRKSLFVPIGYCMLLNLLDIPTLGSCCSTTELLPPSRINSLGLHNLKLSTLTFFK